MKEFSFSEAKKKLSDLLIIAQNEEVVIKTKDGEMFSVIHKQKHRSPFDIPGITTKATTEDILKAIMESRKI